MVTMSEKFRMRESRLECFLFGLCIWGDFLKRMVIESDEFGEYQL